MDWLWQLVSALRIGQRHAKSLDTTRMTSMPAIMQSAGEDYVRGTDGYQGVGRWQAADLPR